MSQIYNGNTKRPKPKENQLRILGIHLGNLNILLGIHLWASVPGESAAKARYLSLRIHPKSCCIFPLKITATYLSGSGKDTVGA